MFGASETVTSVEGSIGIFADLVTAGVGVLKGIGGGGGGGGGGAKELGSSMTAGSAAG